MNHHLNDGLGIEILCMGAKCLQKIDNLTSIKMCPKTAAVIIKAERLKHCRILTDSAKIWPMSSTMQFGSFRRPLHS